MTDENYEMFRRAGAQAGEFSTQKEGAPWRRMLVSLEEHGIWIRVAFLVAGGMGETKFMVGWDELAEPRAVEDPLALGIDKCIEAMEAKIAEETKQVEQMVAQVEAESAEIADALGGLVPDHGGDHPEGGTDAAA